VARFADAISDAVRRHKRQILRIALQTAVATLAIYLVVDRIAQSHLSWAVISALLTIGVSADITYRNAMGRAAAACIGAGIGLLAAAAIGGPVIVALLPAVVLANMISTVWPSLRYGAVTAAIVALEPDPEFASALARTGAIVAGTLTGAAASFLVWPVRGRDRANLVLRRAIGDCQDLLRLIERGVGTDDHHERDEVHARFLKHLETARARVRETRFSPNLKSGASLRDAARGIENLWHAIVILDRAVSEERRDISGAALDRLRPLVDDVQRTARAYLAGLAEAMKQDDPAPPDAQDFCRAVTRARDTAGDLVDQGPRDWPLQGRGLHAVVFGIDETERQLLRLGRMVLSGDRDD